MLDCIYLRNYLYVILSGKTLVNSTSEFISADFSLSNFAGCEERKRKIGLLYPISWLNYEKGKKVLILGYLVD